MHCRALYFLAAYGHNNYIEGRFLALVQAVEAFHRRFADGVYVLPEVFDQQVAPALIAAIPGGLDASLVESLKSRIRFGNEYSLRKRLRLLFREHEQALEKVVPDAERFIDPIVEQRNAFTPFPEDQAQLRPNTEDWLRYNFVLRALLDFCFLKAMGLSDETVRDLASRCEGYRGWTVRLFGGRT
jgi:hypothetical protein